MPEQMSLLESDVQPELFKPESLGGRSGRLRAYNLFAAIFPPLELARQVNQLSVELRRQHGLQGRCLQVQNLHISLHGIAAFRGAIPLQLIDAAKAAAASITCPPLNLVFDRVCSFNNMAAPSSNAFVLRSDGPSDAALGRLRQALAVALRRSGLHPTPSSTPHITMLYDRQVIHEHPVQPINWTATSFALVLSHQGLGHYEWLGQWPLG